MILISTPTPDEIATAKAEALARFGSANLELVELTHPIGFAGLFAPFGFQAWCAHVDEQARDLVTSHQRAVIRQRVWPAAGDLTVMLGRWPAAAKKIADRLYLRAGRLPGEPRVELLRDVLAAAPKEEDAILPGLSRAKAAELLRPAEGEPPAELWAVVGPGPLSLVLAAPDADVYHAAQTAHRRATEKGERLVEAKLDFVRQAVRWTAQPLDALLEDQPALSTDLKSAFDIMGGEGAEASSKSL